MFQMRANIVAMGVIGAALLLPELAQAEQTGHASWYALHSRTASGEMMNPSAMTAAHRSLPFGTKVLVENLSNGKAVVVRINDRGPFIKGRIIDVSKAAASVLGMLGSGTARVKVSASGGSSLKVAAKEESPVKVATATTKMESASGDKSAKAESTPVGEVRQDGRRPCQQARQGRSQVEQAGQGRKRLSRQVHEDRKGLEQGCEDRDRVSRQTLGQERNARRRPDEVEPRHQARRLSCLLAQDLCRGFAQRFAQGGCGRFQGVRQAPPQPGQEHRPGLVRQPLWRFRA